MSAQIAIEQGQEPWAPAADAELVRTLHVYDMPLIGVIRKGRSLHLFRCIEGHVDAMNLWAYTALHDVDVAALEAASPEALDDVIGIPVGARPVVVALSRARGAPRLCARARPPLRAAASQWRAARLPSGRHH